MNSLSLLAFRTVTLNFGEVNFLSMLIHKKGSICPHFITLLTCGLNDETCQLETSISNGFMKGQQ